MDQTITRPGAPALPEADIALSSAVLDLVVAAKGMYDSIYYMHGAADFLINAPRSLLMAYSELGAALEGFQRKAAADA